MDKTNVMLLGASAALVLVLLTACGGGSSDPNVAETPLATDGVPEDAASSVAGMAGWMTRLAASSSDALEPLDATRFTPPAPDDSEPLPLN